MKRVIDQHLLDWKNDPYRKPLLVRGARQIGKTYAIRQLGNTYPNFVEINFERNDKAKHIFEEDLDPKRIVRELVNLLKKEINPENTLLFFDEVQAAPKAIIALRYFYEEMPKLHIIAAGSLLDFAIQKVGIPVGRVASFYMYPMSFCEFLEASDNTLILQAMMEYTVQNPPSVLIHERLLRLLGEYMTVGGMPEAVASWIETQNILKCSDIHASIIDMYKQDFVKYAKQTQLQYLGLLIKELPFQLGKKFKYSTVSKEHRARELSPCLDLMVTAGIVHTVIQTAGQGIPLGAQAHLHDFKIIFLDVALNQTLLGLDTGTWLINPLEQFINKRELVEAFVGLELLAYANPRRSAELYYWQRMERNSEAEVDYLVQMKEHVIPIEVKSGAGSTLKSMHMFLESHPHSPYGIRFSTQNYSIHNKIHSYPLYAVAKALQPRN